MHRAPTVCLLTMIVLIGVLPNASAKSRNCTDVVLRNPNGSVWTQTHLLIAVGTTCRRARKVARYYLSHSEGNDQTPRPYGYRCRAWRDSAGVDCRRRRALVSWGYH